MDHAPKPSWGSLYELARPQSGYFRNAQAAAAGFSKQLLHKHVASGRLEHAMRGVYRLAQFPPGEQDELVKLWLWSDELGVFSHETALALHQLSDALPACVHLTVPDAWHRRVAIPPVVLLHHARIPDDDRTWVGQIPVTTVGRTLRDAIDASADPDLIAQAAAEALARRLVRRSDIRGIVTSNRRPPRD